MKQDLTQFKPSLTESARCTVRIVALLVDVVIIIIVELNNNEVPSRTPVYCIISAAWTGNLQEEMLGII